MLVPMQCPGCAAQQQKNRDNPGSRDAGMRALKIGGGSAAPCKPVRRAPLQPAEDRESDLLEKRPEEDKRPNGQLE